MLQPTCYIWYYNLEMDASTEEKQQYLRVEILEAGYDPEDFI